MAVDFTAKIADQSLIVPELIENIGVIPSVEAAEMMFETLAPEESYRVILHWPLVLIVGHENLPRSIYFYTVNLLRCLLRLKV